MKIFAVLVLLNLSTMVVPQKASAQVSVSFQMFYDQLSPYGSWVDYPSYGYVWIPSAGPGFSPYGTGGHWVFTTYGWTWVSDYAWGWAPFHYGRWMFDPMYGWIWVPDTVWGPAWVVWRSSPGYYGWAPLRPGISISIAVGHNYSCPNDWWVFVPGKYVTSPVVYNYYAPRSNNVTIINNTTIINKTYSDNQHRATYIYGPERESVQKVTGKSVQTVAIKETDRPGQSLNNNELRIYKPQVERNASASGQPPAPKKVTNLKDVKPVASSNPKDVTPSKEVKPASAQSKDQSKTPATTPNVVDDKQQPQHANPMNDNKKQQKPQPHKPNPKEAKVTNQVHSDEALALTNGNLVDRSLPENTVGNLVQYDLRQPVQDQKQNQVKNIRGARKGGK